MPEPLRGEVWDAAAEVGEHPFVILSQHEMHSAFRRVTGVLVTGSDGPQSTHVPLGPAAGLTGYQESYANCTDLHSIRKYQLLAMRGRVSVEELNAIAARVGLYLGTTEDDFA